LYLLQSFKVQYAEEGRFIHDKVFEVMHKECARNVDFFDSCGNKSSCGQGAQLHYFCKVVEAFIDNEMTHIEAPNPEMEQALPLIEKKSCLFRGLFFFIDFCF
jgi:hypothetical protein